MPVYTYSFLGLVHSSLIWLLPLLASLKVICSCKVPVSFFFQTSPSLTPLPYNSFHTNNTLKSKPKVKHFSCFKKYRSTVQQLAHSGRHPVNRQEQLLAGGGRGGGRWQSWRTAGNRRRKARCLTPIAQVPVPCCNHMHLRISESSKLKGLYVGSLLYGRKHLSHFHWSSP